MHGCPVKPSPPDSFLRTLGMALGNVTFFNGQTMPIIGLGTWQSNEGDVTKALDTALEVGYRHIDTAYLYQNEAAIGRTLKKWFDSKRLKREDIFIVTKLPLIGNTAEKVEKYLKRSLTSLQLKYVDLYLIHHPVGLTEKGEELWPTSDDGRFLVDNETDHISLWKAMEAQVNAGRARNIGLSNFSSSQIKHIIDNAHIHPANLQIELHVYFQQRPLVEFCKAHNITICAYAPLGSPGFLNFLQNSTNCTMDPAVIPKLSPLTEPVVVKIAEKYNKTPAQILLRHIIQKGIVVIPKSVNPARIQENFQIFGFHLNELDVQQLDALDRGNEARLFTFNDRSAERCRSHPQNPFRDPF